MTKRTNIRSGAPWESRVGYSRAVRVENFVAVSGTTAIGPDGELMGEGDAYTQARRCIEIIVAALQEAGASPRHVVRTRIYVTNIDDWEAIARAHVEAFGAAPPSCAMVQVAGLIDPRMLVEIEADAIVFD